MLNPIEALRGFLKRREKTAKNRVRRHNRLAMETLEGRRVLSATNALPAIMGTVYADGNSNGVVDVGEGIQNATVVLWLDDGDGVFNASLDQQVGAPQQTDADGEYCFDNLDQDENYFVQQQQQTVNGSDLDEQVSALIEGEPQLIIDSFDTRQLTIAIPPPVSNDADALAVPATEAIGGERDLAVELQAGTSEVQLRVNPFGLDDVLLFDSSAGTVGTREVTWDGVDGVGDVLGFGLGGIDLTQGGTLGGFTMRMGVDANGANARLRLYQGNASTFSEATVAIPVTGGAATSWVFIPFSSFTGPSVEGNVDAIQLILDTGNRSVDGQIDTIGILGAQKADFANDVVIDLELEKTVNANIVNNGDTVTWTLTLTNNENTANAPATGVVVTDVLPAGVSFVNATPSEGTFSGGTWTLTDPLEPGETETLTIQTTVDSSISGGTVLTNVAQVTAHDQPDVDSDPGDDDGDQSDDDEDNAAITLGEFIDLEVSKVANTSMVEIGDEVTFTITITNNANNANTAATGVQVTDNLPTGMTLVSATPSGNGTFANGTGVWSLVDPLAPGASQTLIIAATVDSGVQGESKLTNTVQVTAVNEDDADSNPGNDDGDQSEDDESNAMLMVGSIIDLELDKTVNVTNVDVGDMVVWTINVTNNPANANTAATNVQISDTIPSGVTLVSATPSGNGMFANGIWTLVDPLAPGSVATLTLTSTVNAGAGGADIINAAEVSQADQTDIDSIPGNDDGDRSEDEEDDARIVLNPQIDLELQKTVNATTVIVGDTVTWTVSLTNNAANANADATGVTVADILPAGLTLVNSNASSGALIGGTWTLGGPIAPGGTEALTIVTTVDSDAPSIIENVAQVNTANETDVDSVPNDDDGDQSQDDEDSAQITTTPLVIDLELDKTVSATNVNVGDQVTWTITVTNNAANANTDATGVQVTDVLPSGVTFQSASPSVGTFTGSTWTLGTPLAPGASATLSIVTLVNSTATGGDLLMNIAQVAAANEPDIDSSPANDNGDQSEDEEAKAQVQLNEVIDLDIDKTVDKSNVTVGEQVTWTIVVRNDPAVANTAATGVTVNDVLPSGVTFVSASATNGSYSSGLGIWTLAAPLNPGDTATLTVVSTVNSTAAGSSLLNVAEVGQHDQTDIDSSPGNDDGDQSEDDEDPESIVVSVIRPISKRALLAST